MESEKIGTTPVLWKNVLEKLGEQNEVFKKLNENNKIVKFTAQKTNGGHFSCVHRLDFYFEDGSEYAGYLKTQNQFRKHSPPPEGMKNNNILPFLPPPPPLPDMHNMFKKANRTEVMIYHNYKPTFDGYHLPPISAFETESEDLTHWVLVEDLGKSCYLADYSKGFSKAQTINVMKGMARFHAFSVTRPDSEEVFEKLLKIAPINREKRMRPFPKIFEVNDYMIQNAELVFKAMENIKVRDICEHEQFNIRPVISHGDLWCYNVFFKLLPDGSPSEELHSIIDYQHARPSNGLNDICRIIATSCNPDLREEFKEDFLRAYYEKLKEELAKGGLEIDYDFDKLIHMYDLQLKTESLFSICNLSSEIFEATDEQKKELFSKRFMRLVTQLVDDYKSSQLEDSK